MQKAIDMYHKQHEHPNTNTKKKGYREVCLEMEQACLRETKMKILLSSSTLQRRVQGGRGIREFNAEKAWLSEQQAEIVITCAVQEAERGFPFSHRRLREHVDEICRARYGDDFPGVGKRWTDRFVEKHSDRLKPYWSRPLDGARARAVNPITKEAFFTTLKSTINGEEGEEPIRPECMYGTDETGIQEGIGTKERVLGGAGKKVQHQQRSGERENITVIVTICADGTSIPPAIIYKGEGYQTSWKQDNPLNAS
jgi:hypothetical protein